MECPVCKCIHNDENIMEFELNNPGDLCEMCQRRADSYISNELADYLERMAQKKYKDNDKAFFVASDDHCTVYINTIHGEEITREEGNFLNDFSNFLFRDCYDEKSDDPYQADEKKYDYYEYFESKLDDSRRKKDIDKIYLNDDMNKKLIDVGYNSYLISVIKRNCRGQNIKRCNRRLKSTGKRCTNYGNNAGACGNHKHVPADYSDSGYFVQYFDENELTPDMDNRKLFEMCLNLLTGTKKPPGGGCTGG